MLSEIDANFVVVSRLMGRDGMEKDVERWDCGKLMELKAKCNILPLGQDHPKHKHSLGEKGIEYSPGSPKTPVPWVTPQLGQQGRGRFCSSAPLR